MGFFTELRMSLADTFGIGKTVLENQRIIAGNHRTSGTVTRVKTCWWIKINTKAARLHALDGAKFPHIIYFTYCVDGAAYRGVSCAGWHLRCPGEGEAITVCYDENDPKKCAVLHGARL